MATIGQQLYMSGLSNLFGQPEFMQKGQVQQVAQLLDNLEPWNIHIQQVMRARWGDRVGLGVLEQLAFGEHVPSGLTGFLDGYQA